MAAARNDRSAKWQQRLMASIGKQKWEIAVITEEWLQRIRAAKGNGSNSSVQVWLWLDSGEVYKPMSLQVPGSRPQLDPSSTMLLGQSSCPSFRGR